MLAVSKVAKKSRAGYSKDVKPGISFNARKGTAAFNEGAMELVKVRDGRSGLFLFDTELSQNEALRFFVTYPETVELEDKTLSVVFRPLRDGLKNENKAASVTAGSIAGFQYVGALGTDNLNSIKYKIDAVTEGDEYDQVLAIAESLGITSDVEVFAIEFVKNWTPTVRINEKGEEVDGEEGDDQDDQEAAAEAAKADRSNDVVSEEDFDALTDQL
jgi:hypothetical protein